MSEAARALYDQLRALESRAVQVRGRSATRREAVKAASRDPYSTKVTNQRVSSWLPEDPSRAQVPSMRCADQVWALVRVWSDWAKSKPPSRKYWYELIEKAQPSRPSRAREKPLLPDGPTVPEVRHSLPPDTSVFTGRDAELDQITAAMPGTATAGRTVTICAIQGMPGVGKTALALHIAHMLRERYPDRQLFIDLYAHTPGRDPLRPEDALAGLLAAVGVDPRFVPGDLDGRAALWRDRMVGQRALLVLDNAIGSGQVVPLLAGSDCAVLVTSRRHLGDLPGVIMPVFLGALPPQQAAEMFTRLARRATGGPGQVADVVELAGFLPLAISLLAHVFAGHRSWTLDDLVAEIRAGILTLKAEHNSIAAAFEVSYRHLDGAQQQLFRLLGLHLGTTIDTYAAAALAKITLTEAIESLDALHREGLVTELGHRRYGMHDLLREYARHLASTSPVDNQAALDRLLDYYEHSAVCAETILTRHTQPAVNPATAPIALALADAGQALAWARTERANLLGCLDHAVGTNLHARVITLTAAFAELLRRDGPWTAAISRHTAAIQAAQHVNDQFGEANAHNNLATIMRLAGDAPGALSAVNQALAIYRDLGDRPGEATALNTLGNVRQLTGDYQSATADLSQALRIYRDLGDRLGEATALTNLGAVGFLSSEYSAAAQALELSAAISDDLGDQLGKANALNTLGAVGRVTGNWPGAAQALEQALGIYRNLALSDRRGEANALNNLGTVRSLTGDYPAATTDLKQALRLYRDIGDRLGEASALTHLGTVQRMAGDHQAAASHLEQALGICRDLDDRGGQAEALNETGALYRTSGDPSGAHRRHREALQLARAIPSPWDEAHALAGIGRCAKATGDTIQAQLLLRQAEEIFLRIGAAEAHAVRAEYDDTVKPGAGE